MDKDWEAPKKGNGIVLPKYNPQKYFPLIINFLII